MKNEFQQAIKLLGSNAQYYNTYTNNQYGIPKQAKLQTAAAAHLTDTNTNKTNHVLLFSESSAPDGYTFLLLDFDDKENLNDDSLFYQTLKRFNITEQPTLTIKTPTGSGMHMYYLVPDEYTKKLENVSLGNLDLTGKTQIEVKLATKKKFFTPLPGNQKEGNYYKLALAKSPIVAPSPLLNYLDKAVEHHKDFIKKKISKAEIERHKDIDDELNVKLARKYLFDYMFEKPRIQEGQRNNLVYGIFIEIYTRNISQEYAHEHFLDFINERLLETPLSEDELLTISNSAFRSVTESERSRERSHDEVLSSWLYSDDNPYGFIDISYERLEERIDLLNRFSQNVLKQRSDLRRARFETCVYKDGVIHVPMKNDISIFTPEFENALQEERPNISELAGLFKSTHLHFKSYSEKAFNEEYKYLRKTRTFFPTNRDNDSFIHGIQRIQHTNKKPKPEDSFVNKHIAYFRTVSAFEIDESKITDQDKEDLNHFLNLFRRQLTNNQEKEEWEFLLDRVAKLIQSPTTLVDNIPILFGHGGEGKTFFFNIVSSILPDDVTQTYQTFAQLTGNHADIKYLNVVEELSSKDLKDKALDLLKGVTTAESMVQNPKYKDPIKNVGRSNIMVTTNNVITELDVLENRRITIFAAENALYGKQLDEEIQRAKDFIIGTKEHPFWGLKLFYNFLVSRIVLRTNWKFQTQYQKELILDRRRNDAHVKSIYNFIANLGLTYDGRFRFPITISDVENSIEDGCNDIDFIVNRHDILFCFKQYYPEMDDGAVYKQVKNYKFVQWANKNPITKYFNSNHRDPNLQKQSVFCQHIVNKGRTFTTLTQPIKELLNWIDNTDVKLYGLEEHKTFLNSQEEFTREEIESFLLEQYPDETPGQINHVKLIEFSEDEF